MNNKIKSYVENSWIKVSSESIYNLYEDGIFNKEDIIEYIDFLRHELIDYQKERLNLSDKINSIYVDSETDKNALHEIMREISNKK